MIRILKKIIEFNIFNSRNLKIRQENFVYKNDCYKIDKTKIKKKMVFLNVSSTLDKINLYMEVG